MQVVLGARGSIDLDLASGWAAHVLAEIERQRPTRIVIDASRSVAVASAFYSGVIRIRDRSGLPRDSLLVHLGSDRMREAAHILGVDQLVTIMVGKAPAPH